MCRTLVDVSIGSGLHNPAFLFVSVAEEITKKFVSIMKSEEYTYL